jgi:hypothetical protein
VPNIPCRAPAYPPVEGSQAPPPLRPLTGSLRSLDPPTRSTIPFIVSEHEAR